QIEQLDNKLDELAANGGDVQTDLYQQTRSLYRISRAGMLPVTEGFSAMLQYSSRLQRYAALVGRMLEQQQAYDHHAQALRNAIATGQAESRAIDDEIADLQQQQHDDQQREQEQARHDRQDDADDSIAPMRGEPPLVRDVDASDTSNAGVVDVSSD